MTRTELRRYLIEKSMDPYRDPQEILHQKLKASEEKSQRLGKTLKGAVYGGTWGYLSDLLGRKVTQQ